MRGRLWIWLSVVTLWACEKSSVDETSAESTSPTEDLSDDVAQTGILSVSQDTTPGEVMAIASASLESAMDGDAGQAIAGTLELSTNLLDSETQSSDDPLCANTGTPWAQAGEEGSGSTLSPNSPAYAGRFFYCTTNLNTYSPDSTLGALTINSVITCIIDKAFPDGYPETLTESTVTIDFSTPGDCVSQKVTETLGQGLGVVEMPISAQKLGADADWSYYVKTSTGGDKEMYFLATAEKLGTMIIEYDEDDSTQLMSVWQITLDNNTDATIVRYQKIGLKYGDGSLDGSHLRLLLTGQIDATSGAISSLDRFEGVFSQGVNPEGFYNAETHTIKGTAATGFRTLTYLCPDDTTSCDGASLDNISLKHDSCLSEDGDCTGVDGLTINSTEALEFKQYVDIVSSSQLTMKQEVSDWIETPKPVTYAEVTLSRVPESGTITQYTCNQTFTSSDNKNCSTLFTAADATTASTLCAASEDEGGHGCCTAAKVYTNAWGSVASYEVVPAGQAKGSGTSYDCE